MTLSAPAAPGAARLSFRQPHAIAAHRWHLAREFSNWSEAINPPALTQPERLLADRDGGPSRRREQGRSL